MFKPTQWYNTILDWISYYYPNTEIQQQSISQIIVLPVQQKIDTLRTLLKQKTGFSQHQQGKLEMYFTQLIKRPEYKDFGFTKNIPISHRGANTNSKLFCFTGKIILDIKTIKCPLSIDIVFQDNIQLMPKVYVRNPTFTSKQNKIVYTKPNQAQVYIVQKSNMKLNKIKHDFKAVTGGVQALLPQMKHQKNDRVAKILDKANQIMKLVFPFVKMNHQRIITNQEMNIDTQTQELYQLAIENKNSLQSIFMLSDKLQGESQKFNKSQKRNQKQKCNQNQRCNQNQKCNYPQIIMSNQQLDLINKCIQSQQKDLKQFENLQEIISQAQYYTKNFQEQLQRPTIKQNDQEIFDLLVEYRSCQDCLKKVDIILQQTLQQSIQSRRLTIQQINRAKQLIKRFAQRKFDCNFVMNKLITNAQAQKNK